MLSITGDQIQRLDDASYGRFEQRCVEFLRERFPELDAYASEPDLLASVRAGIASARFRGLQNGDDVVLYLYLRQLLGAGFDTGETPIGAAMNDASLAPSARVARAAELAAAQSEAA